MSESPTINQLTPEQKALIPVYQEKWRQIAFSIERIDRDKATEAIKAAYHLIDEDEPEIIFFDSPYEAAKHADSEGSYSELDYADLLCQVKEILINIIFVNLQNNNLIDENLLVTFQNIDVMYEQEMVDKLADDYDLPYEFESGHVQTDIICYELGWLDFCISELKFYRHATWNIYKNIIENCGIIYAYKKACLICDRPTKMCFDDQNRVHAEGEAAIEFNDGFKIYVHHGIRLPEKYGKLFPNDWKAQWLLEERNAELRRVLIQGIGYERICEELGAVELDNWQEYTLLKIDNYTELNQRGSVLQEPMCLLKMICPSTGNVHILRVPPDITSAHAAVCWINWGIQPEDFAVQS